MIQKRTYLLMSLFDLDTESSLATNNYTTIFIFWHLCETASKTHVY